MSTQSFAPTQPLSNLSRRTAAILAAALAAIAIAFVVVALNAGSTTQSKAPTPVTGVATRTITPPGADLVQVQTSGPATYSHSFAPAGSQMPQTIGSSGTALAGQR